MNQRQNKRWTELSWVMQNWVEVKIWTWFNRWNNVNVSVNVTASGAFSMMLLSTSGVAVMVLEQTASTLSFFFLFDYSWPRQAMEVCIDKYFVSGILRRAGDLETCRPWHGCVLIKGVWPQNALSVFMCVHVLIRAVCSQCALVFSVLWLNNRSDVIQGQMRGRNESWMGGERKIDS